MSRQLAGHGPTSIPVNQGTHQTATVAAVMELNPRPLTLDVGRQLSGNPGHVILPSEFTMRRDTHE